MLIALYFWLLFGAISFIREVRDERKFRDVTVGILLETLFFSMMLGPVYFLHDAVSFLGKIPKMVILKKEQPKTPRKILRPNNMRLLRFLGYVLPPWYFTSGLIASIAFQFTAPENIALETRTYAFIFVWVITSAVLFLGNDLKEHVQERIKTAWEKSKNPHK